MFKINERSYKNILIYHNGYVKVKDLSYGAINFVNPSYFIIKKTNGYIQESNGSKIWS